MGKHEGKPQPVKHPKPHPDGQTQGGGTRGKPK